MKRLILYIFTPFLIASCSSESSTWTSKAYHNTTAHYNGYYYALDEITKIEATISKSQQDDYNRILRLYPKLDSTLAKGYDKEIQEAIKMASIAIQRHPNSIWVDDAYILVGKARLYSFDWGNAIQTFKYVNNPKITKDPNTRHRALIYLGRTFTEHAEYNNAEAVFAFLEKEELSRANRKDFLLERAYYYQVRNDLDKMVSNLTQAAPLLTKKDRPGRAYFILGQVYQELGFESEAYNYYRRCISTNPEYEVDFYARLYMAQVAEISKSRNIANARKSFKKLLKDSKNKEFKDKIYYEMGVFEKKRNNIDEAMINYNLAIRQGSNKLIDGEAYLGLGEIYYDTLKNYELAQAYYDSAVTSLSKDHPNYASVKARQEVLDEFVKNLQTVQWQDSLLVLAKMDTAMLRSHITAYVDSKKEPELKKGKKKKKERVEITQASSNIPSDEGWQSTDWYFGNTSAVAIGQTEFLRIWGNIPLEDNWRRSARATSPISRSEPISIVPQPGGNINSVVAPVKRDPVQEEYDKIVVQLPKTEQQVNEALKQIEDAYFNLGDIYYFKLQEKENALSSFEKLLTRFPETTYKPEVLYKLYLIHKDSDPARAERYASELKSDFPETNFAKILVNPSYLQESSQVMEKQKALYKTAYEKFESGLYDEASDILSHALAMEKTAFVPRLELLQILIVGKTQNVARYQLELDSFIKRNPDSETTAYAKSLLDASREFELRKEKEKGINYIRSFEEPHYFILVYSRNDKMEDIGTQTLSSFNTQYFKDLHLNISNLILNDIYAMVMVSDLPRISSALEYHKTFNEKLPTLTGIKNFKFNNFVITKDNFNIFYRTKGLDEYLRFFERNYRSENP